MSTKLKVSARSLIHSEPNFELTRESEKMRAFFKNFLYLFQGKAQIPNGFVGNPALKLLSSRRSCRRFKDDPVPDEIMNAILEAGRYAPSSVNLQTWSFVAFDRHDWHEIFGTKIPFNGDRAVVICSDVHRIGRVLTEFETKSLLAHTLAVFNAGLAAMAMTIAAEALGLASVMLSDTGKTGLLDIPFLREKMKLPDGVLPVATLVLGYRKIPSPGIPPRFPKDIVVFRRQYQPVPEEPLRQWYQQMKIGYKLTNLTSSFENKLHYYLKRFDQAETVLREAILNGSAEPAEVTEKQNEDVR